MIKEGNYGCYSELLRFGGGQHCVCCGVGDTLLYRLLAAVMDIVYYNYDQTCGFYFIVIYGCVFLVFSVFSSCIWGLKNV